jgi:hypothetical protein
MYGLTYAERLRGTRFWLPLLALLAATVIGVHSQAAKRTVGSVTAPVTSVLASDNLNLSLRGVLTRLGANGLSCQSPVTSSSQQVSCHFGAVPSTVTFRSFPSHRVALRALPALERAAGSRSASNVSFLIAGAQWVATGEWSQTGDYQSATSPGAQVAQQISSQLSGCLELLPGQHGSCSY